MILIGLSLVIALGALLLALAPLSAGERVLVLTRDLARDDPLERSALVVIEVPEAARPLDALDPEAPLPPRWPGEAVRAGTILSESVLAGSALGRSLAEGESLVSIALDPTHLPPLEAGDSADLWGFPENCDTHGCSATLVSSGARISSVNVGEAPSWSSSDVVRIDLIVDTTQTDEVLGHAGTGTLSVALTSLPSPARGDHHRRTP